ncbi:MAG TPA: hypothetical protein VIM65_13590 [Cyclobacteriaceae bacterium]
MKLYFSFIIIFFITCAILSGCEAPLKEYPPERFLSKRDKYILLKKILVSLDVLHPKEFQGHEPEEIQVVYKLQYYLPVDTTNFFLITEDHNVFAEAFGRSYFGYIKIHGTDTIVRLNFSREKEINRDSFKILFDKMIAPYQ